MIEKKIEHIAYQLEQNLKNEEPGAIVLIGAGCSVSAGIPIAEKIVDYILENFKDNPDVKCFSERPKYEELMSCLGPRERNRIFKHYVENAKVNVSHIYLAHLMLAGYVDYIVTVNFDNLAQKALALYNVFPPTYDISILKDLTTTSLDSQSITYLHGQYNGLWQLNTKEEMKKVIDSGVAKTIFNQITNNRLWIVVGYSGEDFIFDQLVQLGRFDNGLYWVGYKEEEPSEKVQEKLINVKNTESFWVKGYDADSFFLKLNSELKKENPKIFAQPFTFLSELQNNIVDIDDSDDYKSVKERFEGSKKMVKDAIYRYEKRDKKKKQMTLKQIEETQLQKELINILTNENYTELINIESKVFEKGFKNLNVVISDIYNNWGTSLSELSKTKTGKETDELFIESFEKYRKAIEIKPDNYAVYYNWGVSLSELAKIKSGKESENLIIDSIEKYRKAVEIKQNDHEAFINWGTSLMQLAKTKTGKESENLFNESFEKYRRALEIKQDDHEAYANWGVSLSEFAKTKTGKEAENILNESFEKYKEALEIKQDLHLVYSNWGNSLMLLAKINPEKKIVILEEAEKLLNKSKDLGGRLYNLACLYSLTNKINEAFEILEKVLLNDELSFDFVEKDEDWNDLREHPKYLELKEKFSK